MWWWPWGEGDKQEVSKEEPKEQQEENPVLSMMNRGSFKRLLAADDQNEMKTEFLMELYQTFKRFDQNGDGRISADELAKVLSDLGSAPSMAEVKTMIDEFDADKDGCLDLEEFVKLNLLAVTVPCDATEGDEIDALFKAFDQNQNGLICAKELFSMMDKTGENVTYEECLEMIQMADMDGDGHVDINEFRRLMSLPDHGLHHKP